MNTYCVTRTIPDAADFGPDALRTIATTSVAARAALGLDANKMHWVESAVTGPNEVTCIIQATDEDVIRQHSLNGGFPVDKITLVEEALALTFFNTLSPNLRFGPADAGPAERAA